MQRDVDDLLDDILGRMSGFFAGAAVTVMLIQGEEAEVVRTTAAEEAMLGEETRRSRRLRRSRAVVDTQRPCLIEDTRADVSDWVLARDTAWIRSNLTAPIKLSGEAIGFLSLDSGEPAAFPAALLSRSKLSRTKSGSPYTTLATFAESEPARSAAQEERLLAEALGDVSAALSSTLELEDVLDLILDRAARVVPYVMGRCSWLKAITPRSSEPGGIPISMLGVRLPTHEPLPSPDRDR